jgi:small conductance mechanosensitive channel
MIWTSARRSREHRRLSRVLSRQSPAWLWRWFQHRRLEYDGIGCSDDIDRARGLILESLRGREGVLAEPAPDVLLMDFAPSSISLRVRRWIAPPRRADALDVRDKVLTAVKHQLTAHPIDLPFPTQQILFHVQPRGADGE